MAIFTRPNGTSIDIPGSTVKRVRRTRYREDEDANTRIDATVTAYVVESVEDVAQSVQSENENFTHLNTRDGSEIWFNAKKVAGPLAITQQMQDSGYNSSIKLMNYRQYVVQTHEEVAAVISDADGTPLPPPTN